PHRRILMSRYRAMTVIEVIIVLSFVIIVFAVMVLPMISNAKQRQQIRTEAFQIRGIHSVLVLHAQGNNGHYVGILSDGVTIDAAVGLTAQGRIQALIDQNYFTKEFALSPHEAQTGNTSYAMLQVNT